MGRPKMIVGSAGSAMVGGKIVILSERLYGSPTVIVWSQGRYNSRVKIVRCAGEVSRELFRGVYCSRKIAVGSAGMSGIRAKVRIGCVMPVGSRKIAYRYVMIGMGRSADDCELQYKLKTTPCWRRFEFILFFTGFLKSMMAACYINACCIVQICLFHSRS